MKPKRGRSLHDFMRSFASRRRRFALARKAVIRSALHRSAIDDRRALTSLFRTRRRPARRVPPVRLTPSRPVPPSPAGNLRLPQVSRAPHRRTGTRCSIPCASFPTCATSSTDCPAASRAASRRGNCRSGKPSIAPRRVGRIRRSACRPRSAGPASSGALRPRSRRGGHCSRSTNAPTWIHTSSPANSRRQCAYCASTLRAPAGGRSRRRSLRCVRSSAKNCRIQGCSRHSPASNRRLAAQRKCPRYEASVACSASSAARSNRDVVKPSRSCTFRDDRRVPPQRAGDRRADLRAARVVDDIGERYLVTLVQAFEPDGKLPVDRACGHRSYVDGRERATHVESHTPGRRSRRASCSWAPPARSVP